MLLTDGYKLDHRRQYPKGTQYVYSTWIPRSNKYLPEAPGPVDCDFSNVIIEDVTSGESFLEVL